MKTKIITALSAVLALTMTACGTISPPAQTQTETTTITTATSESIPDSDASSEAERIVDEEQVKSDTFIAEFFDSNISFADVSGIVTDAMKSCSFKNEIDSSNGIQKSCLQAKTAAVLSRSSA